MCVCVSAEKTQHGKKKRKRKKRDPYDSDKDILQSSETLSFSLSLSYSHIIHTLQDEIFPDPKRQREHCIALHYKVKKIDPLGLFPLCA